MTTTEELIGLLSANAAPVRRLRPPVVRCALWLAFAAVIVAMLGISRGVRPDLAQRLADPAFTAGLGAAVLTGILAAAATFMLGLPDRSGRWALLPLPGVAAWVGTIGYGCLTNWVSLSPDGVTLGATAACFATLVLTSTPLSLAMLLMMRRLGSLRPTSVTLCGALAVAAITATALSLFHSLNATVLILLWNFGVAALFLCLGSVFRRRLCLEGTSV